MLGGIEVPVKEIAMEARALHNRHEVTAPRKQRIEACFTDSLQSHSTAAAVRLRAIKGRLLA
jgi:hypothetical protein